MGCVVPLSELLLHGCVSDTCMGTKLSLCKAAERCSQSRQGAGMAAISLWDGPKPLVGLADVDVPPGLSHFVPPVPPLGTRVVEGRFLAQWEKQDTVMLWMIVIRFIDNTINVANEYLNNTSIIYRSGYSVTRS